VDNCFHVDDACRARIRCNIEENQNEYLKADDCFAHVQCMFCCQALLNDLRACRIWTARPAHDIMPVSTMLTAHHVRKVKHICMSGVILQAVAVPDNACSMGQRHSPPWEFKAFMLPSVLLCYTSLSLHVQAHSSASVDQQGAEGEHKAIDLHCNLSDTLRTCSRNKQEPFDPGLRAKVLEPSLHNMQPTQVQSVTNMLLRDVKCVDEPDVSVLEQLAQPFDAE